MGATVRPGPVFGFLWNCGAKHKAYVVVAGSSSEQAAAQAAADAHNVEHHPDSSHALVARLRQAAA
jgi:hypothetical protein